MWRAALILLTAAVFSPVAHAYEQLQLDLVPTARLVALDIAKNAPAQWDAILRDYPSARFKDARMHFIRNKDGSFVWFMCGEVVAKNGFGGYADWDGFSISDAGISTNLGQGTADNYNELCSSMAKPSQVDDVDDFSQWMVYQPSK